MTVTRTGRKWGGWWRTRAPAIDALERDSQVDPQRIYLFGYSMGGTVGLYTAALDSRVKEWCPSPDLHPCARIPPTAAPAE